MRESNSPSRLSRKAFTRRSFLAAGGVGLTTAGLGLSGCGPADSVLDGRTRLRQLNLFSGGDGNTMIEMHEQYQQEHPEIDFRAVTIDWGEPFYTKLAMSAAGGRAADISTAHVSRLTSLAPGRLLDPFDEQLVAEAGIDDTVVLPNIWRQCFFDGQLYAIPLDTHVHIHYFNPEICEQAGVLDDDGRLIETSGVDEYFDLCRAVQDVTGDMGVSLDTNYSWPFFWAMYRQQDAELTFTEDSFELDDEAAFNAFDVLYRLSQEGLAPTFADGPGATANFDNLQAGLFIQGNWEINSFNISGVPFSAAQMPDLFGNRRTRGDSHVFVLPHQDNRDPDRDRAAVEYMAWMLRNSFDWGAGGGHIPAYQPVVESPEYQALDPHAYYAEAAENVQYEPDAWFSGSANRLAQEIATILHGIHTGTTDPEAAVEQFRGSLRLLVDTPEPL